jgi:hypothetical protein
MYVLFCGESLVRASRKSKSPPAEKALQVRGDNLSICKSRVYHLKASKKQKQKKKNVLASSGEHDGACVLVGGDLLHDVSETVSDSLLLSN